MQGEVTHMPGGRSRGQLSTLYTDDIARPVETYLQASWAKFRRDKLAIAGLILLFLIAVVSFGSPLISAHVLHRDPITINLDNIFAAPGGDHWLGTDEYGRDVLSRLLYAGSVSLSIGLAVSVVSMTLGVLAGLVSGFFGGIVDDAINAVIQSLMNIPLIYLLILMSLLFRPSPIVLALIIGVTGWMGTARLVRGQVFSVRERDYMIAARSVGAQSWRLMTRHILPNVGALIIYIAAFDVAGAILVETGLSFLGVGVQPPTATWGNMLINSRQYINNAWWLLVAPGVMVFITILSIFLLANGLRDALDPWLKN